MKRKQSPKLQSWSLQSLNRKLKKWLKVKKVLPKELKVKLLLKVAKKHQLKENPLKKLPSNRYFFIFSPNTRPASKFGSTSSAFWTYFFASSRFPCEYSKKAIL